MEKKKLVVGAIVVVVIAVVLFYSLSEKDEVLVEDDLTDSATVGVGILSPGELVERGVNWEKYNYDFVDENVKGILSSMIAGKKTAFYLPSTGYINVSRGAKFGVAFALNNPNPSGENRFEYEWTAGSEDCGVGLDVAQGWIERGWESWGKIPQGWIDHMTVYFSFPSGVEPCSVRYDFEIRKDGSLYDSRQIEFNLV